MKFIITIICLIPAMLQAIEIQNEQDRLNLVAQIIKAGRRTFAKTEFHFKGRAKPEFVLNDNLKLSDGTYLPFTIIDARKIAKAWNCRIPNFEELKVIANEAYLNGNQFPAETYLPNDSQQRYSNSNLMMTSPEMHRRSSIGHSYLIDGHFKWYTNDGKIFGFAKGDGTFYHNWPSGRHRSDQSYFDYSHGVRLVCPN